MQDFSQTPPQAQPPKKKKKGLTENQKSWLTFGAIAAIGAFGGAYLLLLTSDQEVVATELATEIKTFEGEGYGNKLKTFGLKELQALGLNDDEFTKEVKTALDSVSSKLTMSEIIQFTEDEFGGVKIANIDVETKTKPIAEVQNSAPTLAQVDKYTDVVIKKKPEEPLKYYYSLNSEMKQYITDDLQISSPFLTVKSEGTEGWLEFNPEGYVKELDNKAKKITYKDGSGIMTYATLENATAKFFRDSATDKTNFSIAASAEKIEGGETIKLMLGDLKPIKFNLDFSYTGDSFSKLDKISKANPDLAMYLSQDPAENLKKVGAAEKFNAQTKLSDLTILSDEMGVKMSFDLNFEAFPYQPMPKGSFQFTIKNYPDIVNYLRNFMPLPQEEVDAKIFEAKEYFEDTGKDLIFVANFDGSKIVKLGNGKKIDVIEQYTDATKPAEEQPVEFNSKFEKDVESKAKPAPLPEIQKRELN